jgi:hypothetical protein
VSPRRPHAAVGAGDAVREAELLKEPMPGAECVPVALGTTCGVARSMSAPVRGRARGRPPAGSKGAELGPAIAGASVDTLDGTPIGGRREPSLAHDRALVVPAPWSMARHALPNVIEGKLIPLAIFLGFLDVAGTTSAVLAALAWSAGCLGWRLATGRKVPGLVVLSTIGLAAKTVLAIATGSMVAYFLQPTITTALVGAAFLVSVPLGRPLAERLAHDFCPFDADTADHPHVRGFFVRLSLLWAATSLTNACVTLWLLFTQPVATFVVIKTFLGPAAAVVAIGAAVIWFRTTARQAGVSVVLGGARRPGLNGPPSS